MLLNLTNEKYFGLDDVGTRVWQLLTEHDGKTEPVIKQMLGEYQVDEATLRQDITNLIADMVVAELVAAD